MFNSSLLTNYSFAPFSSLLGTLGAILLSNTPKGGDF